MAPGTCHAVDTGIRFAENRPEVGVAIVDSCIRGVEQMSGKWAWMALAVTFAGWSVSSAEDDWTRFRGANGTGVVASANLPMNWSDTENVKWKVDLPGLGSSSPIVLGERVYVTCYTGYGMTAENAGGPPSALERHLIAFNVKDGSEAWRTTISSKVDEDPWDGFINEHGFASPTPATDGKRIYVQCGKTGMVAFDLDGKQLWTTPLGTKSDPAKWGDGASPVVWENLVIANAGITDHAIVGLNSETGEEVWEYRNSDLTNSWATPIVVRVDNHDELVCAAPGRIFALNPESGKELWTVESPIQETVCASLASDGDVVFLMGGRAGNAIAVRCGGSGDVGETHVVWTSKLRAGIGTPVVVDGRLYWSGRGMAFCADCADGKEIFQTRLNWENESASEDGGGGARRGPAGDYASPIVVGDKVLVLMRGGNAQWWKAGEAYEPVGQGDFGDDGSLFNATPAIAGDMLLIRSNKRLYCIGSVP